MTTDAPQHPLLSGYPIRIRIPVEWGDMDAYGHVNNTVFFRYFESARVAFLERCGFLRSYERERIGAILHSTSCRFRLPLFYPDSVLVGGRATEVATDRFTMGYVVVSETAGRVAGEGMGVIVSYDYERGKKCQIPVDVRGMIDRLERDS